MDSHLNTTKHVIDFASAGVAIATLASWLPPIAALFTIIWTGIQIYAFFRGYKK